jgi:hypothetical protein
MQMFKTLCEGRASDRKEMMPLTEGAMLQSVKTQDVTTRGSASG